MKISVALLILLTLFSLNTFAQVDIPDAKLRAAIENALGVDAGEPITKAEMETLTELISVRSNISDLTGLEFATNLTNLHLRLTTNISDLAPLRGLTRLTNLNLGGNAISDISPLAGLTELTQLELGGNSITDPSPLAELTQLTALNLGGNDISDISALAGLTELRFLWLYANTISDLSPLARLTQLIDLWLYNNNISDISPLAGLTISRELRLEGNPLNAMALETHIPEHQSRGTHVSFDEPKADPPKADLVEIPDDTLRTAIENALNKRVGSPITPAEMETLTGLEVQFANISNLTGLEHATNLTELRFLRNAITDLSPLSGLTKLEYLDLNANNISDISALLGLTNLTQLGLQVNPLSYASIYTHIPTLQDNGVGVRFTNRTPTGLAIDSGNNQNGEISTPLAQPLVVKVTDENDAAFEGVPVTFTVTQGGGTLSTTSATTDADGLAESTLTLGNSAGTNTVEVSASNIQQRVVFNAEGSVTDAPAQVNIPDTNLRAKVLAALEKPTDAQLTPADMKNLTVLSAVRAGISDLTGLQHATNLTELWLNDNQLSDISALADLTNLKKLYISDNQISDISALAGLTNLTNLALSANPLSDISALADLTNLTRLLLNDNQLSDISALALLAYLTELNLGDNRISDISALAGLTNLTNLALSANPLSDISALAGLTNLTTLSLISNQISDISTLAGLTNLTRLWLGANRISDISALSGLTNLESLRISYNQLSDISALSGLTNLTNLGLSGNRISDISALSGLTNLTWMPLDGNPLSYASIYTHIPTLQQGGVSVTFTNRTPRGLAIDSGNNQTGETSTPLAHPFVVKVTDEHNNPFEGVPVTFTVTQGDGTLSVRSTTTNADGLAESTLTLGSSAGTNTVEVSASKIQQRVVFNAEGTTKRIVGDVNQDGVVNIFDLVLVANRFGQTGEDGTDVNEDGLVNILDLVLVAGAFGDPGSAAPAKHPQALELLTATDVKQWLIQARGLGLTDATSQKGLIFLEQLLAVLTPSKTTLLPNYPNPFNPETWIPYRLSKAAFVTLTIYDQRGRVVRQIDVGYRTAAVYERRDKAIYWDGRNAVGEAVASGVYFYTLTTGDFTATRKMLILK